MACDLSKGRTTLPCKDDAGGIKAVYITNYGEYAFNGSSTAVGHIITTLPVTITSSNTFKFELKNSANTFSQDSTSSRDNGTTIFTQTVNFTLPKLSSELEFQMKMLVFGRPQIFVERNNGDIILLGEKYGCEVTAKIEVGGTLDSKSGYSLVAVATEANPVWYLSGTASTALKAAAATASVAV